MLGKLNPTNLKRNKGINASILYLRRAIAIIIPVTQSPGPWLLKIHIKIHSVAYLQIVIVQQFSQLFVCFDFSRDYDLRDLGKKTKNERREGITVRERGMEACSREQQWRNHGVFHCHKA
ncbi:uncharacterized protein G2W53_044462 [Senna tora]|uniref:Uncharacterized protein n=1 Tax=Senna tora TaxID=362788 RepID=A0A834SCV8_9FABA|nr:uncharacterized protein G2W53_044462 [Senna tora]